MRYYEVVKIRPDYSRFCIWEEEVQIFLDLTGSWWRETNIGETCSILLVPFSTLILLLVSETPNNNEVGILSRVAFFLYVTPSFRHVLTTGNISLDRGATWTVCCRRGTGHSFAHCKFTRVFAQSNFTLTLYLEAGQLKAASSSKILCYSWNGFRSASVAPINKSLNPVECNYILDEKVFEFMSILQKALHVSMFLCTMQSEKDQGPSRSVLTNLVYKNLTCLHRALSLSSANTSVMDWMLTVSQALSAPVQDFTNVHVA